MTNGIELFAYLNIEHPMIAWEVAIGRLQSVSDISGERFGVSLWSYSLLQSYVQKRQPERFANELRLERVRMRNYPDRVSRLHGMYFFESEEDANIALDRWGMPERKRYISAVRFFPSALTKVDSEWITFNLASNEDPDWMESYWRGDAAGERPLIEVLATGKGVVLDKDLRIQAYRRIYELWPTSTPLLAAACCAFDRCHLDDVALVKPGLVTNGAAIQGNYYIYMHQFSERQSDVVAAVRDCQEAGDFPPIVVPPDGQSIFSLPDMRSLSFEIRDPDSLSVFSSVHHAT